MKPVSPGQLIDTLRTGGVAIMRTDTIYGIVGRADSKTTVERIYDIKGRTPTKSPIVIIGALSDMFDVYDDSTVEALSQYWPGPNSIILPSSHGPSWLTRGNHSIAYRLPADEALRRLLRLTGPLIAPSANPEGLEPARTIEEARQYFNTMIDVYEDEGIVTNPTPSSLYKLSDGSFRLLR